jgi:hypothetical protein
MRYLFLLLFISTVSANTDRVNDAALQGWVKEGAGCSVSHILYDDGGDFAIFKAQGEDSWGSDVRWFAGRWRRACLKEVPTFKPFLEHIGGDVACEVANKRVADVLGACAGLSDDIVSSTTLITLTLPGKGTKRGSLQLFEKGVISGSSYLGVGVNYAVVNNSPLYQQRRAQFRQPFQWLVILDVITGHMDRHTNNFMVRESNGSLLAIDGGMSFAPWHPDPSINSPTRASASEELSKLYYWANPIAQFELANDTFTPASREAIQKIYARRHELQHIVEEVYREGSLADERAKTMLERIELLYQLTRSPSFTIKELWNYRTKEQVESVLLSDTTVQAILALPSLLADRYGMTGPEGGAIEEKLNEIAALVKQYGLKGSSGRLIEERLREINASMDRGDYPGLQ